MFSVASPDNRQNDRCTQNAICLHYLTNLLNICRKFEFVISQGSVATYPRWGGYYRMGFVANFIHFHHCKALENRLCFDKVRDTWKVGTFLRQCKSSSKVKVIGQSLWSDDEKMFLFKAPHAYGALTEIQLWIQSTEGKVKAKLGKRKTS